MPRRTLVLSAAVLAAVSAAISAAVFLTSCGNEPESSGTPAATPVRADAPMPESSGKPGATTPGADAQMVGTWAFDLDATRVHAQGMLKYHEAHNQNSDKEMQAVRLADFEQTTIDLELRPDGTFSLDQHVRTGDWKDQTDVGTWSFRRNEVPRLLRLSVKQRDGQVVNNDRDDEWKDGRLVWTPDASGSFFLKKK